MSSQSRTIHFNNLPEAARLRFADCLAGKALPKPLVSLPTGRKRGWIVLAMFGLPLLCLMWVADWDRMFLPPEAMIGFAIGTLCTVAGIVGVMHAMRMRRALPFRPGRYLFATDFIEATGPVLRLYSLNELTGLNATHHYTNGIYTGTRFVMRFPGKTVNFSIAGRNKADGALSEIHMARATLALAIKNQDLATLATLDPLFEAKVSGNWNDLNAQAPALPRDAVAQAREVPWPFARAIQPWALALLAAVPLTPAQWWLSNRMRDAAVFQRAQQQPSEENLRQYLQGGTAHVDEVKNELLPKTMLAEAKRRRSVQRLRQFTRDFAGHRLVSEAEATIRTIYQDSLQHALQQADPAAHDFLRKLFAWLEQNQGQPVEVRFDAPSDEELREVDKLLAARGGKAEGVPVAPIAPSFTPERCQVRQSKIVNGLRTGFARAVTAEILTLAEVKPGRGRAARPSELPRPTLAIHYDVKPGDGFYTDREKTRAFVAITVDFKLALSVPGADAPMNVAFSVQPPEHFVVHDETVTRRGGRGMAQDATVYDTMATEAFYRLSERLGATFYKGEVK